MKVLVSGACGQDGSMLCRFYLDKGYDVYGIKRRSSASNTARIDDILYCDEFILVEGDITDSMFVRNLFSKIKPDLFFNMAAMSHVHTSFSIPSYTFQANCIGVLNCLESIREESPSTRMLQASTSEMFGSNYSTSVDGKKYQNEETKFSVNSPYACSKLAAHNLVKLYRRAYNVFVCAAITFNHEQPGLRGKEFVTRKISLWVARFHKWMNKNGVLPCDISFDSDNICADNIGIKYPKLRLGNINAYRDWMYAYDAILAFDKIINSDEPDDYVIGTGEAHTVSEFCEIAFNEIGISNYMDYIVIDPKFYRPVDVDYLCCDASKIEQKLGWKPTHTFEQLVKDMVRVDMEESGVV